MCNFRIDTFKILTTVFFEIRDADFFGGKDTVGYSKMVAELDVTESKPDLFNGNTYAYIKDTIQALAKSLNIPENKIRTITETEYEENAD